MRKWILAAALVFTWKPCSALISVMEALPSTRDAIYVGTTTPQVLLNGGTFYSGTVPSVSLYVASNTVLGNCVAYATGSIMCLGVRLSTTDPAGSYIPYTGATANVNLGAKTLTTTGNIQVGQVGAGTSASSNFYFDGLSASGGGYVRIGAGANQATGYYWGGTRGYSMQERYDLTGTPFTLHDELNNVDRFYLDTSGMWYFPSASITASSFTALGTGFKGALAGNATTATALATAGTSASSGQLSRGIDASGNNLNANVDATATSGSTNPYQSGGAFTALAGKAATFTGISSSCASGFHISTDTYVNGILTGGSCVADGSGGGGGSSTMTITAVSDNFIGSVTGSQKVFTLSQTPANAAALTCILDGLLLSQTSDYTYAAPTTITITTAPAANSTGFFCNYFVNTSTLPAAFILSSTQTVTGPTTFAENVNISSSVSSSPGVNIENVWTVKGSSWNVNYSTAMTFAIATATNSYVLHWNVAAYNSPGELRVIFNNDSGANYDTQYHGVVENGAGTSAGNSVDTYCGMGSLGNSIQANHQAVGHFEFGTSPAGGSFITGIYQSMSNRANTNRDTVEGGCQYGGSPPFNSITFLISAGNYVGDVWLEKINK